MGQTVDTLPTPRKRGTKGAQLGAPAKSAEDAIRILPVGKEVTLRHVIGGSLAARRYSPDTTSRTGSLLQPGRVKFFWRFKVAGFSDRQPIGSYNPRIRPGSPDMIDGGYSVEGAFRVAESMSAEDAEARAAGGTRREVRADKKAAAAAAAEAQRAAEFTLGALMADYAAHLRARGTTPRTALDVENLVKNHVPERIKALPAHKVTGTQFVTVLRAVTEDGKKRTADKLRSYLLAAYNLAMKATRKASVSERLNQYGITHNPLTETDKIEEQVTADKNPLPIKDARRYWQAIKDVPGVKGATLRLHVLLGGQRIEQLVRAKVSDIRDDGTLRILDIKGIGRRAPREHFVPLPEAILADVEVLKAGKAPDAYLFSTNGGTTALSPRTLSAWAKAVAATAPAGDDGGEVGIAGFTAKRIRSGVETLLAASRVGRDIRGQLQSHGLGGVQGTHYDGYSYMREKSEALAIVEQHVTGETVKPAPPTLALVQPQRRRA